MILNIKHYSALLGLLLVLFTVNYVQASEEDEIFFAEDFYDDLDYDESFNNELDYGAQSAEEQVEEYNLPSYYDQYRVVEDDLYSLQTGYNPNTGWKYISEVHTRIDVEDEIVEELIIPIRLDDIEVSGKVGTAMSIDFSENKFIRNGVHRIKFYGNSATGATDTHLGLILYCNLKSKCATVVKGGIIPDDEDIHLRFQLNDESNRFRIEVIRNSDNHVYANKSYKVTDFSLNNFNYQLRNKYNNSNVYFEEQSEHKRIHFYQFAQNNILTGNLYMPKYRFRGEEFSSTLDKESAIEIIDEVINEKFSSARVDEDQSVFLSYLNGDFQDLEFDRVISDSNIRYLIVYSDDEEIQPIDSLGNVVNVLVLNNLNEDELREELNTFFE